MKRLLPLIYIVGGALLCVGPYAILVNLGVPVIFPVVELPAERIWLEPLPYPFFEGPSWVFLGQELYFNNTLPSLIIADIVVIIIALTAGNAARKRMNAYEADPNSVDEEGDDHMVPKGWQNTFEAVVEAIYDLNETIVGSKWADRVFPVVGTIFLFLIVANWLHFVPITDAVGLIHCAKHGGHEIVEIGDSGAYYLASDPGQLFPAAEEGGDCDAYKEAKKELEKKAEEGDEDAIAALAASKDIDENGLGIIEGEDVEPINWVITPFVRTATTDINLTIAFAIVAMIAVQYFGVAELGLGYFTKFVNIPALSHGPLGAIEFIVGLLEAISEVLKILSFALRLLGNIFAGTILLFVMAYLAPVLLPLPFFLFEVFIGFLQALVFAMLTMVFIAVAQIGHGDHDDDHGHADDHGHEAAPVPAAGD